MRQWYRFHKTGQRPSARHAYPALKHALALLSRIWRTGSGRPVALLLLASFALLLGTPDTAPFKFARLALFDQYQKIFPRATGNQTAVIVAIDEDTLTALGQWPWPRNYFAALIDDIAALKPAAIGIDIVMPEADRASPFALAQSRPDLPESVRKILSQATSNDKELAQSLARAPVVLGAAGFDFKTSSTLDGLLTRTIEVHGTDPLPRLNVYPYVLASLPEFQRAAHGQALMSGKPEQGIMRRVALLSNINGTITPGLSLEMMRLAHRVPHLIVDSGPNGVNSVRLGDRRIPLQNNGEAWIHYSKFSDHRYVSALSMLKHAVKRNQIEGKMVLIGLTGVGLQDFVSTPLGDVRHGVEVHAQLIESFEDGHFLTRPLWLKRIELAILIAGGLMLIWAIPHDRSYAGIEKRQQERSSGIGPGFAALVAALLFAVLFGTGLALFYWATLLFDAASLFIALGSIFTSLIFTAFIESVRQRKNAELALLNQRLEAAKLAGELAAARRIQLGTLPDAVFPGESRFYIEAMLEPAREVGGDLYDFFMMDESRLFFIIGDVSGKGLPASLFMVVTKALAKSAALRTKAGVGEIVMTINKEMARENPQILFVTVIAGILDADCGALELVNAGHDAPWLLGKGGEVESINGDGGPPLCVVDDYAYPVQHLQLKPEDTLFMFTDGIAEAMNETRELYGVKRVMEVLNGHPASPVSILREDVRAFVGKAETADDLTLLAIRWRG